MVHAFTGVLGAGVMTAATDLRSAKVARTKFARFHDLNFGVNRNVEMDPTSGRREIESVALGNADARVSGTLEGTTEGPVVEMLRSLMGGTVVTSTVGTNGKQHVIPVGNALGAKSRLTLERSWGAGATDAEAMAAVISMMRLDLQGAGYAKWAFAGIGSKIESVGTATAATLPDDLTLLGQRKTTVVFDAVTLPAIRNLSWELQGGSDENDFDVSSQERREAEYGGFKATATAEMVFADMSMLKKFWGAAAAAGLTNTEAYYALNIKTERQDVIAGGTAAHTAMIDMPRAHFVDAGVPQRGKDQVTQNVSFAAVYKAASSKAADVTIINTVASYA